jgi:hypothetical protein
MKILFFGAGVLGSLYAARLQEAGQEVLILARGQRLADIREHGIVLEDGDTGQRTTTHIKAVEQLAPDDAYDLVVVLMRKNQVSAILPDLAANQHSPSILFMNNNVAGPDEMVEALGQERVLLGFPGVVLALAFVAALGPSLDNAIIAIALTGWPGLARLARAETLVFRSHDYISVVRLQGGSHARVIFLNLMPLCLPSVIVRITLSMSSILLTAAGLGFLGLGAQPPAPEWGAMLSTGRRFMLDHWWLVTMPGCTILIVSLAFNLLGDGLRDILDPRSEQK